MVYLYKALNKDLIVRFTYIQFQNTVFVSTKHCMSENIKTPLEILLSSCTKQQFI